MKVPIEQLRSIITELAWGETDNSNRLKISQKKLHNAYDSLMQLHGGDMDHLRNALMNAMVSEVGLDESSVYAASAAFDSALKSAVRKFITDVAKHQLKARKEK